MHQIFAMFFEIAYWNTITEAYFNLLRQNKNAINDIIMQLITYNYI